MIMKNNQKVLELHPHLSKLIDSLCFELAVNMPDENSLSLLQILEMRRTQQITQDEFRQLYMSWLQSKNVFDMFSAKQVRIYPKAELISNESMAPYLHINSINSSLQLLNDLYDQLCSSRKKNPDLIILNKETEDLFSFLDNEGNIHLRMSQLFFLAAGLLVYEGATLPHTYQQFKPLFKHKNKSFSEVEGMVCLRCFKNYFLFKNNGEVARTVTDILKDMQLVIRMGEGRNKKQYEHRLPNIIEESFARWRKSSRFSGVFETRKKRLQIYHRIFDQNQNIFFFHGGKEDALLSENYFIKKYGEDYIRSLQIDNHLLKEFSQIVKEVLNEYLGLIIKMSQGYTGRHHKSGVSSISGIHNLSAMHNTSAVFTTPSHQISSTLPNRSQAPLTASVQLNHNTSRKNQQTNHKMQSRSGRKSTFRDKTPTKQMGGHETRRFNVTPNSKKTKVSPFIQKQFGSVDKSLSKRKQNTTPTKSHTGTYSNTSYGLNPTQVYRNSKKQGLEKDSFYEKLFFFRNKRVQSFDIVMKRLKGK